MKFARIRMQTVSSLCLAHGKRRIGSPGLYLPLGGAADNLPALKTRNLLHY
jgi:hypothetical protein